MPIVTCEHCEREFPQDEQYAYLSGFYCSKSCYDTLFLPCLECEQICMDAKVNLDSHSEQLCNKCRNKKHGWTVVFLRIGPFDPHYGGSG